MNDMAQPPATAAVRLAALARWSIADAWAWFIHAWRSFIHLPYLGVVALVVAAVLVLRGAAKILA